ncbi:MAG: hypothetical protein NC311_11120 [Muribaculaceae bacterium]|nr:hypothetical protein [Muribaculaceae bacterium]
MVYKLNDHLDLKATLRPEEAERATVTAQITTVDPVNGKKTVYVPVPLVRDSNGDWPFSIPKLNEGETQIVFTVQVAGKAPLSDGTYENTPITEKKYMITVYRSRSNYYEMPGVAEKTAIRVGDATNANKFYGTIPEFDPDFNFYYVNLPHETESVKLYAETGKIIYAEQKGRAGYTNEGYKYTDYVYTDTSGGTPVLKAIAPGQAGYVPTFETATMTINGHQVSSSNFADGIYNGFEVLDLMVGDNTVEIDISVPGYVTKHFTVILNRGDIETTTQPKLADQVQPLPSMTNIRINERKGDAAKVSEDKLLIPDFDPNVHFYNVVVPYSVDHLYAYGEAINAGELRIASIDVDNVRDLADPTARKAEALAGWRDIAIPLSVGNENNIEFVAYGRDVDGKVTNTMVRYIVNVVRLPFQYVAPEMEFMGISEGTMTSVFHGRTYNYYATVPYDVDSVDVEAIGSYYYSNTSNKTKLATVVKLVGGDHYSVGKAFYVTDSVKLNVGDNLVRAYLYDVRDVPDGGYPYYVGVYSLTIHRETRDGVVMELMDDEIDTSVTPAQATIHSIQVTQDVPAAYGKSPVNGQSLRTNVDYAFNEYSNYVYVHPKATSVNLLAKPAYKDNVIVIDGIRQGATGGVDVELTDDVTTVVPITVYAIDDDTQVVTLKRYTVTVIRGYVNTVTGEANTVPNTTIPDYFWRIDATSGLVREISVVELDSAGTVVPASTKQVGGLAPRETIEFTPYTGTIDMPDGSKLTTKLVTLRIKAVYDKGWLNDRVEQETRVRVNGHTAQMVEGPTTEGAAKTAVYMVTLPMTTFTDRFDVRVDVPYCAADPETGVYMVDHVDNVSYVLDITDTANAPKAIELDEKSGKPLRWTQADLDAWLAADPGNTEANWAHKLGEFKYGDKVLTGPQLDSIVLDENDGTTHSGTFTTMFYGDVFNYRATASVLGENGKQQRTFSVFAYVEHSENGEITRPKQYNDFTYRTATVDDVTTSDANGHAVNVGDYIDAKGNFVLAGAVSDPATAVYDAGTNPTGIISAAQHESIKIYRGAYIEVYDEAGHRYTISQTSNDYVHFTFPEDEKGNCQILTLTFRVIQYADSGYEMVSEYKLKVYPTGEPIIDDLYLYRASMDEPEDFDTLTRDYYGTIYKKQPGFAVYAEAEYFDMAHVDWRDGRLEMTAKYGKLVPYVYTEGDVTYTIMPDTKGYVVTYEQAGPGDEEGLVMDKNGKWPGQEGYIETKAKLYSYKMPGVDELSKLTGQPTDYYGHETFTGYFQQETLPDMNDSATPSGIDFYGDGTTYLPWDLPSFEVVVTLTYPSAKRTATMANVKASDANGHAVNVGDYIDAAGNWVADATTAESVIEGWKYSSDPAEYAKFEALSIYKTGAYTVHMTRSRFPKPVPPLDDMEAFQMMPEHRDLIQIGAIMTGPDYSDVLYGDDGKVLPPAVKDKNTTPPTMCASNFDPQHPYYLLELDHRMNQTWLKMDFDPAKLNVVVTSANVKANNPESYYYDVFNYTMKPGEKQLFDFGEAYYADEDFKTLLQVTVTDKSVPNGNVSKYMIWVVRGERSWAATSQMGVDLFYGMSEDESRAAAENDLAVSKAGLTQAEERTLANGTAVMEPTPGILVEDLSLKDLWGTRYLEDRDGDGNFETYVYPGIIDNDKFLYRDTSDGQPYHNGQLKIVDVVPSGVTALNRVTGFSTNTYLYTTTLPMSARYVTVDLTKLGSGAMDHASVVYNNAYYHVDPDSQPDPIKPTPDATLDALVNIPLKQGERVSYIFVTVHPDLGDGTTLTKDDQYYKDNATTYVIRVKRLNNEAFANIWVTDTEFTMDGGTVTHANRPDHYEQMWLITDENDMKRPIVDVRGMYTGGVLDTSKKVTDANGKRPGEVGYVDTYASDAAVADLVDMTWDKNGALSDGTPITTGTQPHNIYVSDIKSPFVDYGVMVSSLDTYIYLNAEAFGTKPDGSNDDYYIIIEEYGVENPQQVDSRTYRGGTSRGRVDNAKFRLDPSKDGTQVFQFTIVNERTNTTGVYFLHVFRDHDTEVKTVQTKLVGKIATAATRVPVTDAEKADLDYGTKIDPDGNGYRNDFKAKITIYRKTDLLRYYQGNQPTDTKIPDPYATKAEGWYSVEEAVVALGLTVLDSNGDGRIAYNDRFYRLLNYSKDGVSPLVEVTNVPNGVTGTNYTEEYTGAYSLDLTGQLPGAYMIVFERAGSLDYVLDNVLIYPTYDKAQYDFGTKTLRAGDLNDDGIIDDIDLSIFNEYKNAMDGVYRDLAGRVAVNKVQAVGVDQLTTVYAANESIDLTELANLKLTYNGNEVKDGVIDTQAGANVAYADGGVTYYLSRNSSLTSIDPSDLSVDLVGSNRDKLVDLSDIISASATPSYAFRGASATPSTTPSAGGNEENLGNYYLYGMFKFYDRQMPKANAVEVVYRIAVITVTEATDTASYSLKAPAKRPAKVESDTRTEIVTDITVETTGGVYALRADTLSLDTVEVMVESTFEKQARRETALRAADMPVGVDALVVIDDADVILSEITETVETSAATRRPDYDERPEIPVFDEDIGPSAILPEGESGGESAVTEAVTSDLDRLAKYMAERNISMDSAEGAKLLSEFAGIKFAALTGTTPFDARYLDLDGNNLLTSADLGYLANHWKQTTYKSCRLDNMYSNYQAILGPWV